MAQENVEIVRVAFDLEAQRDVRVIEVYDRDVVMDFSESPFAEFMQGTSRLKGVRNIQKGFRDWYEAFEDVVTDVDELIDADEQVIVVFTYRGRGRVSGAQVEWKRMAGVWTFREGKVVRVAWFRGKEEALEAAGLSE
ncbi:MAG: nuclear transport factor 2 family protein [Solirubrobacterales bacterium]